MPPSDESPILLVPSRNDDTPFEQLPFQQIWKNIRRAEHLYTPYQILEIPEDGAALYQPLTGEALLQFIDTHRGTAYETFQIGLIYSDPRIVKPQVLLGELPTATMLKRFFHNERLDGLAFNPSDQLNQVETTGYTTFRWALPGVIGMAESDDPFAEYKSHVSLAASALYQDRIFEAHYHAGEARRGGEPLDSYFFAELETLMTLGLGKQAMEFHQWYTKQGGSNKKLDLYSAHMYTLSGRPQQAAELVHPLLQNEILGAQAALEMGRALYMANQFQDAVNGFNVCLEKEPGNIPAMLGKGLAIRAIYWDSDNESGLRGALECFLAIINNGHYHAAEALHHAGTIYMALKDMPQVEACCRKTLTLKNSPVSRRNLCLSLHAQGRIDEARVEYDVLRQYDPQEAEPLHRYFQSG